MRGDDNRIPALPYCHRRLTASRPPLPGYPSSLGTLGYHLRKRRLDLGLTQKVVAERIGVNRRTFERWELNLQPPITRLMPAVIHFLGYDPAPGAETFADQMRLCRRLLGVSQLQIAERLGLGPGVVTRWETGATKPREAQRVAVGLLLRKLVHRVEVAVR